MADSFIRVPPDSTGKLVDTDQLTVNAQTVQRQRFQIAGTADVDIAPVDATNGLAVDAKTLPPGAATQTTLAELAAQQLDYDTGGGTEPQVIFGLALPASGGPVAGGTATNPIRIDPTGTTPQPISGTVGISGTVAATQSGSWTVTATQGTAANLNATVVGTGTFAAQISSSVLPTGAATLAEQQTQTASLSVLDDWDEADRAKVNPIVGQAGVQGGAGAVSATTQRVVLATDTTVPNVTGNIAADSADSGNPVKIGMVAYSPDGTTPGTAVTEGDRSNAKSDLDGRLLVNPYHPRTLTTHLDGSSAYTDQSVISDPGDGFQAVITNIIGSTGAATALNFFLEEGSTKIFGPVYLEAVAGRGFCSGPIYLPCTASTAVTLTSSANIAQSFQIQYFIQAV